MGLLDTWLDDPRKQEFFSDLRGIADWVGDYPGLVKEEFMEGVSQLRPELSPMVQAAPAMQMAFSPFTPAVKELALQGGNLLAPGLNRLAEQQREAFPLLADRGEVKEFTGEQLATPLMLAMMYPRGLGGAASTRFNPNAFRGGLGAKEAELAALKTLPPPTKALPPSTAAAPATTEGVTTGLLQPRTTAEIPLLQSRKKILSKGFLYPALDVEELVTPSVKLTSDEKKLLQSDEYGLSKDQIATVRKAVIDYRRTHHPSEGWQPYTIEKLTKTETSKGDVWKPVISSKNAGFDFHRNPATGNELTGTERQKKVSSMGGLMANEVQAIMNRSDHNAEIIKEAFGWYKDVETRLRTDYGSVADIYGDLLAALSPDTKLSTNFKFAEDALSRFAGGAFDDQLAFTDKWLADGNSLDKLPDQYIIRQSNGMKYGKNGRNAMLAMLGKFRDVSPGQGPKMRRYGGNIVGTSYDTTVDVWNARTNQRLAGQLDQRHKRVIPKLNAVEGKWIGSGLGAKPRVGLLGEGDQPFAIWKGKQTEGLPTKISGAYGFASDVTDDALFKLREMGYNIDARDLQAFEWLNEKNIWETQGWTPKDKSANLVELFSDVDRYRAGVSPTQQTTPTLEDFLAIQGTLTQGLNEDPMVIAATAPTAAGYYFGEPELSSDSQVVAREGWDSLPYYKNVIQAGLDHNQMDVFVSKVMPDGSGLNSRPGVEIMFDPAKIRDAMPVLKKLLKDQPGYTIIPSNRFVQEGDRAKVSGVGGFYIQWVPEIDIRFDDDLRARLKANPDLIYEIRQQKADELADLAEQAESISGIVSSNPFWYNTEVFGKTADGGFDDGGYMGRTAGGDPRAGATGQAPGSQGEQITLLTELARAIERIEGRNL